MYLDILINIPVEKGRVTCKGIKGITYVYYELERVYDPVKKYSLPKWMIIGKRCEDDHSMMYPNGNYLALFPEADLPGSYSHDERSSSQHIGPYIIIQKVIKEEGLDELLRPVIGKDTGLLLDLAAYSIITEDNAAQYYPEYAYDHPLFTDDMKVYSDTKISEFLSSVTIDQRIKFLDAWNNAKDHRQHIYISYDSTNKNCQAGDIDMVELGAAKDNEGKPIFNYSIAYDRDNSEPLFYEEYPGSINDVSQLQYMIEKVNGYGYHNIGFILDRGYFSRENIRCMDNGGYQFIIMCKGMKELVSSLVNENKGTFEESRSSYIREYDIYGKTVESYLYPSDHKKRYFQVYFNDHRCAAEKDQLNERINKMADWLKQQEGTSTAIPDSFKKYFDLVYWHEGKEDQKFSLACERTDVIDQQIRLCGYFVIITSEKMTAKEALILYKSRDASEKLFRGDKSYLGGQSLRVYSSESADTKIFIEFIALIMRNRIYTLLKEEMARTHRKLNDMTVPGAIKELEKLEMIRQLNNTYILDHAVSKTQKRILKAFGMEAPEIKDELKQISGSLMRSTGGYQRREADEDGKKNDHD